MMIDEKRLIEEWNDISGTPLNGNRKVTIASVRATIQAQPKVGEWIPVSERLPEKPMYADQGYIVQQAFVVEPYTAYWDGEKWVDFNNDDIEDIVAWQPLPEPYKEER